MSVLKTEFAVSKRIEFTGALVTSLLGTITLIIVCQYCRKWLLFQLYLFKCNCFIFLHILNCLRIMDVLTEVFGKFTLYFKKTYNFGMGFS